MAWAHGQWCCLSSRLLHLVLVSLQTLSDGHQHTVDVGVQRAGLLPVGAGKRELGDEGDGGEDL